MVRTTQADGPQAPHDPVEMQTLGQATPAHTPQPTRPAQIAAAPFGDGLKRLPDKLRDLGDHRRCRAHAR